MRRRRIGLLFLLFLMIPNAGSSATRFNSSRMSTMAYNLDILIEFGNGTVLEFSSINGSTVLNATISVVRVEFDWYQDSVFVTSIAGVSNEPDEGLWWQYWVNDKLAPVAANKYIPEEGDVISWRRVPPQDDIGDGSSLEVSTVMGLLLLPTAGIIMLLLLKRKKRVITKYEIS